MARDTWWVMSQAKGKGGQQNADRLEEELSERAGTESRDWLAPCVRAGTFPSVSHP